MKRIDSNFKILFVSVIMMAGFTLLASCKCDGGKPSAYIIPPDSMAFIIAEIHYADAVLITAENQRKIRLEQIPEFYAHLLDKMNISKERFDSSLVFYSRDLTLLAKVYENVIQLLQTKQSQITEPQ